MSKDQLQPIKRAEALALGLTRYFSGQPCKYGHLVERKTANKACVDCARIKDKHRAPRDPELKRETFKAWYKKNREVQLVKSKARSKLWYQANKERRALKAKEWEMNNKEKRLASRRIYWVENPHVNANIKARRRARQLKATPSWLTQEHWQQIKEVYKSAKALNGTFEVDHIIPLQGETVCGLHVPWNLQVLDRFSNRQKRNNLV